MHNEKIHRTRIVVRGYELDSYGHVNNAVYLQYLEQARWQFMKDNGLLDHLQDNGLMLVVIETTIKYIREAVLFDELEIGTTAVREDPFLIFRHRIFKDDGKLSVSRAKIKMLFLDNERKPADIPAFISSVIKK